MVGLRTSFDDWINAEPEEPEDDHPSEEDMEAFEKDEKAHKEKVRALIFLRCIPLRMT